MTRKLCIVDNGSIEHPDWMEDVARKLAKCWKSFGGITIIVNKCDDCNEWHLVCCPSLRELVGGKQDGREIYPRFRLNLLRLVRVFDETPKVFFDSAPEDAYPFVILVGKIQDEQVQLVVVSSPVPGQPIAELGYTQGPKKGQVESRLLRQEDGDVASGE